MKRELRFIQDTEVRAGSDSTGRYIEGLASVFGRETNVANAFREIVKPTAFDRSLRNNEDVYAAYNHDASAILGRVSNKTLTLSTDAKGLRFRAKIPNTQQADDVYNLCKDGYISTCSFAFTCPPGGDRWVDPMDAWQGDDPDHDPDDPDCDCESCRSKLPLRELHSVSLVDVSCVTRAQYDGTSCDVASARSLMFPDGLPEIRSRRSWTDADRLRWLDSVAKELRGEPEKVRDLLLDLEMHEIITEGRRAVETSTSLEEMARRNSAAISREQKRPVVVEPRFSRYAPD